MTIKAGKLSIYFLLNNFIEMSKIVNIKNNFNKISNTVDVKSIKTKYT